MSGMLNPLGPHSSATRAGQGTLPRDCHQSRHIANIGIMLEQAASLSCLQEFMHKIKKRATTPTTPGCQLESSSSGLQRRSVKQMETVQSAMRRHLPLRAKRFTETSQGSRRPLGSASGFSAPQTMPWRSGKVPFCVVSSTLRDSCCLRHYPRVGAYCSSRSSVPRTPTEPASLSRDTKQNSELGIMILWKPFQ